MSPAVIASAEAAPPLAPADELFAALLERLTSYARPPVATYRLQFNAAFTFAQAQQLVPYLHSLGVTTCYASPYLQARPGSMHGYDIVDPQHLNAEIGSQADYAVFVQTLQSHGMSQLLDIVPNHMGIGSGTNAWWLDVLAHGPSSAYAAFFDIDWAPLHTSLRDQVLLPILGDQYGRVLENQELRLTYDEGRFGVQYYEHRLPLEARSILAILTLALPALQTALGETDPHTLELHSLITALEHLPLYTERAPQRQVQRQREYMLITRRLQVLHAACPAWQAALAQTLTILQGTPGEPQSFDALDALLQAQPYRLSVWRAAAEALNYRRFFDINDLAGLRVEEPIVFAAAHDLILRLLEDGSVSGVRIDHPDGLLDPVGYLHQLQRAYVFRHCQHLLAARAHGPAEHTDAMAQALVARFVATSRAQRPPLYMVVEKILEHQERLPRSWPVHGTTGYEVLNQLNGLFVDRRAARRFRSLYAAFVGVRERLPDILYEAKKLILHTSMVSELQALGAQFARLAATERSWRDLTQPGLTMALGELIACFPVYRTYIDPRTTRPGSTDRRVIAIAVDEARQRNPMVHSAGFDYIQAVLHLQGLSDRDQAGQRLQRLCVSKFQQLTGPVMAKGLEDTTFYRYTPLASLNEVGGDPQQFGLSVAAFHRLNSARHQHWPLALLATSTHDTKRGEDVRARLNVLSELPQVWRRHLQRWHQLNRPHKVLIDDHLVPSPQEEYLLYQTLLGAWPLAVLTPAGRAAFTERIQAYMRKALREAKVHTNWTLVHDAYEQAVDKFISTLLDETVSAAFLAEFHTLQAILASYGMWNSLAQTLLKLTIPGVPDIYQGSELWDLSLVDPDNRRPVDYALRQRYLAALQQQVQERPRVDLVQDLLRTRQDGRLKLYVIWQMLTWRRAQAPLFLEGDYVPLDIAGRYREHICAFARRHGSSAILVVVPRLLTGLLPTSHDVPLGASIWDDTRVLLPVTFTGQRYRHLLTDEILLPHDGEGQPVLPLATLYANFPVAVLERMDS